MQLTPAPFLQFFGNDAEPLSSGKVYTYLAGTTTPAETYQDKDGTPHSNPITLSATGQATIYLGAESYKFVINDSDGTLVDTFDNIEGPSSLPFANVKDFGATGDGETDDTDAINDAIATLALGGILYFPLGTYLISDTLAVDVSGISLVGEGADSGRFSWANWPTRIIWGGSAVELAMIEIDSEETGDIRGVRILGITIDAQNTTGVSPLKANPSTSQCTLHNVVIRNFDEPCFLSRSCVGWEFNDVTFFGATNVSLLLEGPNHNTTFNRCRAENTGLASTVDCVIRIGGNDTSSDINFNYCDFEAQDHTYQVELLDCRAVNVNGGYAEPQGGTAVFKLGSAGTTACNGFTVSGFYVQGGSAIDYVFDVAFGAGVNIGSGNHYRYVNTALVNSPANAFYSSIDPSNYLFNVGGTGATILFDNRASGWSFHESGTTEPVIVGGTVAGANTYVTQECRWSIEGQQVFYALEIELSNLASTGFLTIDTNIPYPCRSSSVAFPAVVGLYSGFNLATGAFLTAYHVDGSTIVSLREQSTTNSSVLDTEATNNLHVMISGSYPIV